MTGFWIAAGGLALLAWLLLLAPGRSAPHRARASDANLQVRRAQLAGLNLDLASGRIDMQEHRAATAEIERWVLEEAGAGDVSPRRGVLAPPSRARTAWLGLGIAVFAFGLYGFVGRPAALNQAAEPAGGFSLKGRIRVAPELASRILPSDQVFVFAREAGASGMPLAAARFSASDLPLAFTLDKSSLLSETAQLAAAARIVVGARISRSGDAIPQPGDLRGDSSPVPSVQEGIEILIDRAGP